MVSAYCTLSPSILFLITDAKVCLEHEVTEINLTDGKQWEVKAKNGTVKNFDAVILTIPVPEILKIGGNFFVNSKYVFPKSFYH